MLKFPSSYVCSDLFVSIPGISFFDSDDKERTGNTLATIEVDRIVSKRPERNFQEIFLLLRKEERPY